MLATNAGVTTSNQEAAVAGCGKVHLDKEAVTKIFGLSD
jgi:hypothetical protein